MAKMTKEMLEAQVKNLTEQKNDLMTGLRLRIEQLIELDTKYKNQVAFSRFLMGGYVVWATILFLKWVF